VLLPTPFVNVHPNLNSQTACTMHLNKAQFVVIVVVQLTQQELRVPLGRELAWKVEQPHELPLQNLDQGLTHNHTQFGGDACEYARQHKHTEMRDAQHAVQMFYV
jgi:hypothetical protein